MPSKRFAESRHQERLNPLPWSPTTQTRLGTAGVLSPKASSLFPYKNQFLINDQRLRLNQEVYRQNLLSNKLSPAASGASDVTMSRSHKHAHAKMM